MMIRGYEHSRTGDSPSLLSKALKQGSGSWGKVSNLSPLEMTTLNYTD